MTELDSWRQVVSSSVPLLSHERPKDVSEINKKNSGHHTLC